MSSSGNDSNKNSFNTNSFNTTNSYNTHNVWNHYAVDLRSKISDWLSPLEPRIRHQDVRNSRVAGVGDWLLKTNEFISWRDGNREEGSDSTILFCYGNPGAGKTYISSLVVDTLCDQAGQNTTIACFYFDYASQKEQSPRNVLGSLLKQIVAGLAEVPEEITQAFMNQKRFLGGRGLQLSQIMDLLEITLSSRCTFLCIDALDECAAAHRLKILSSLRQILQKSPDTRIFLTGRAHVRGEVESRLAGKTATLFISPRKEDISGYLRARLDEDTNPEAMDDCLEADILKKIPEAVSEIFLLVSLNIDSILQETTIYRRRRRLGAITDGLGLSDAYGITLERIRAQGGEKARLGMSALMWICHSERPLTVDDLCQALAVEVGSPDFNSDNVPPISTLLGCCQGLVIVEKRTLNTNVRLIHFSLKEYLCTHPDLSVGAHSAMAETCLTYLNSPHIGNVAPEIYFLTPHVPFLEYSALYWGSHAMKELSDCAKSLAMDLFGKYGNHISARVLMEEHLLEVFPSCVRKADFVFSGLHCVSIFGIVALASALIEMEGCGIDQKDSAGFTPLIWAARFGHEGIVELLLARDNVDPNALDAYDKQSPLSWAAQNGHEGVLKLLLVREDVDPNRPDELGQTPFLLAAQAGREGALKLLLAREDVDPERPGNYGRTPFWEAAHAGREGVLKLLLARGGADPERADNDGRTPFSAAAGSGHEGILRLLLTRAKVHPDRTDNDGRAPLYYAAITGHKGAVELLLARDDITIDRIDNFNRTALWTATARGYNEVRRLLRAHGARTASELQK